MNTDIEQALADARSPGTAFCGECGETLYSPMDKLSISLYGKCSMHFEDDSHQEKNLLEIITAL